MIIYKDILTKLKQAGYSSYRLREDKILSSSVLDHIRNNKPVTTEVLNTICSLLHCKIEDIIEYVDSN